MEKAYDLKDLGKKLADSGLPVVESAAELVFDQVVLWLKESAALSKSPYDDVVLLVLPAIVSKVKPILNDICKEDA